MLPHLICMVRASCHPGRRPGHGHLPREGEDSKLCPAANGDTVARKPGVGSREGLIQCPRCHPGLPTRAQIVMEGQGRPPLSCQSSVA